MESDVKILLVEDDPSDRRLTELALRKSPWKVNIAIESASTLVNALDLLKAHDFDIMLLDLGLPDSQGLDAINKVTKVNQNIPIVVLTGNDDDEVGLGAIKRGACDYICKGDSLQNLLTRTIRYSLERKKLTNELKEYDKLKSEFVMNVSHELRTPLTIFRNIISNFNAGAFGKINDRQKENLGIAIKEIDRLARIISDFLDISKIDIGKTNLNIERQLIQPLIFDVMEVLKPMIDDNNTEIKTIFPQDEFFVNVDYDKIKQVLINLMDNAIKFLPDCGGCITIRVEASYDEIVVNVEDNGSGIQCDDINKVFDRFIQVETQVGPGAHGTGLGLAICKGLLAMHGGRIWVENVPTGGANFRFVLPKCSTGLLEESEMLLSGVEK